MQNLASQNYRPYAGKSYYILKDVVEDNWDNFNVLIDVHSQALYKRKTEWGIDLRIQTEERLREILYSKWDEPFDLQEIYDELLLENTDFAMNLKCEIEERLEELESECFKFPSTELTGKSSEMEIIDRQQKGLLLAVGYKTGLYGLHEEPRRKILDSLYTKKIPKNTGVKDVEKWGEPNTSTRLKQIVYSLAWFTKQEKANLRGDYSTSISEREADLKYLKKKYYDNSRYNWKYPKT